MKMIFLTAMDFSTWCFPWEQCTLQCYSSVGIWITQLESMEFITLLLLRCDDFLYLIYSILSCIIHILYLRWSIDVGWISTWVKVLNEWFAATIYSERITYFIFPLISIALTLILLALIRHCLCLRCAHRHQYMLL